MDLPRVFVVSNVNGKADEIAKEIGSKELSRDDERGINYYTWDIENKYYKARVLLCATSNPSINIDPEGVEALIVYCEGRSLSERVTGVPDEWLPLISSLSDVEVQILACDSGTRMTDIERVMEWCARYKFELVDFNRAAISQKLDDPENDDASSDDDDDMESNKRGLDRIIEALHARTWPNMELTGSATSRTEISPEDVAEVDEQLQGVHLNGIHGVSTHQHEEQQEHSLQLEQMLDGLMGGENADFGELFGQLVAMKEHAASLPTDQRRAAAEELVTAFWKAMGGDPEEIDGLDQ